MQCSGYKKHSPCNDEKAIQHLCAESPGCSDRGLPSTPYEYKPLTDRDYMRLIKLVPGKTKESLRGSLQHFSKALFPCYKALSYAWGSRDITHSLQTPSGTLSLTSSLHSALTGLRLPKKERLVWADAICINHTDNKEKSSQVGRMRSIYQYAQQVIVFMGEEIADLLYLSHRSHWIYRFRSPLIGFS